MGDPMAVAGLVHAYDKVVMGWNRSHHGMFPGDGNLLYSRGPIPGQGVYLSLYAYADDVVKAVPGPYLGRVERLADRLQKSVEEMDKEFETAGFAQNRT